MILSYLLSCYFLIDMLKRCSFPLGIGIWRPNEYQTEVNGSGCLIVLKDILSHVVVEEGMVMGKRCWISVMTKQVRHTCHIQSLSLNNFFEEWARVLNMSDTVSVRLPTRRHHPLPPRHLLNTPVPPYPTTCQECPAQGYLNLYRFP